MMNKVSKKDITSFFASNKNLSCDGGLDRLPVASKFTEDDGNKDVIDLTSVLLTPESSPCKDSGNEKRTEKKRHSQVLMVDKVSHSAQPGKKKTQKKREKKTVRVISTPLGAKTSAKSPKNGVCKQRYNLDICNNSEKPVKAKTKKSHILEQRSVTDYFPVRRSARRCKSDIEKQKLNDIEEAVLSKKEEGMKVVSIKDKGRGVVATKSFKQGDFVVEYAGDLISLSTARERELSYAKTPEFGCYMYYFLHKNRHYCIDATDETGRLGRLLNHSRLGNCQTKLVELNDRPYLILVASQDIQPDEELLYDYGDRSKESLKAHPWLRT